MDDKQKVILELKDISKIYGSLHALSHINLKVKKRRMACYNGFIRFWENNNDEYYRLYG